METKRRNRHALTLALIVVLMTSMMASVSSVRAQEETTTTSGSQWRYEYLKNAYFDGPLLGVWVEFDPSTPHPYNADATEEDVRNSAVPRNPSYGYAAVRKIDLSLQWYYYDPTGYYGVTPTATVEGISGYVPFEWDDPAHSYNSGTSIPDEAKDYPYPYGIGLTNERGEILEWSSEGTTYDAVATTVEDGLEDVGVAVSQPEITGNIFQDAFNQLVSAFGDLWSFGGVVFGRDLGEAPWQGFFDSIASGEGILQ